MRERNGELKAIMAVCTDITEKKGLEAQLMRAQRLESVGTLASGLAHDLNDVLAPILVTVHLLKETTHDESSLDWLETLETCTQRGADILRQLLTFARGVESERSVVQPKHLVTEMERIAREIFPKSIHIQTQICRGPRPFLGDATQIQQVLMNLCVNARDAMPAGGTLTIRIDNVRLDAETPPLHPKAHAGDYVVISVADTGTGIPPELMEKIFDPFFSTKPVGQGTGLGLPTALGIAESHGGFMLVESRPGAGTKFQVYLPAAPAQEEVKQVRAPAPPPKGHGEMILLVDDEVATRGITSDLLRANGYRAITAAEGEEALVLFRQHRNEIPLVVTDLMMPRLDGTATIRELRLLQPSIKTIAITGLSDESRVAEARAAGADAVVNKPFTGEQLLREIDRVLR